jgi:hypothetical protein
MRTEDIIRIRNTLVYFSEWVYDIDPFTEEEIVKAIKEMISRYDTPKEGWNALNTAFGVSNFPLAKYMTLVGQQKCIDRLQYAWEWTFTLMVTQ